MAFSTNLSRFDLLTDDARDPFEKKKKTANKTNTNKTQKKGTGKGAGQTQGQGAGKKKKNNNTNGNATNMNNNPPPSLVEEFPELGTKGPGEESPGHSSAQNRNNQNNSSKVPPKEKRGKEEWTEWKKRDEEFVTDSFETDLEEALIQSKLDFQSEQARLLKAKASKKSKKKGVTVSLPSFNDMISTGMGKVDAFDMAGSEPTGQNSLNGFGEGHGDENDPMMAKFRLESQMEIQRERQIAMERKLINSRSPIVPVPFEKTKETPDPTTFNQIITEKDNVISELKNEKLELEKEIDLLKVRFKKICSVFGEAQLKDKATLVNELEKVTKLNHDLNENIQELHILLEQEKSKSHAAQTELRKLNEQSSRRRNPHSESAAQ